MIIEYKNFVLLGTPCMINDDFIDSMELLCHFAVECEILIKITDSFRYDNSHVKGAIVTPAIMSNHKVGHAVDFNIVDKSGTYWNSDKMKKGLTGEVLTFINLIKQSSLRWGGTFPNPDPVHVDDGINVRNPEKYKQIYNEIHNKK